jgi:GT2 family glycosyltransferase
MKHIAVLITCHNRLEKTLSCLRSIYLCKLPSQMVLKVFLVDDGSSDGTTSAVMANFPEVNIIKGNGNLYWNRGMHLAWQTALLNKSFDYYLWLNDDTYLFENGLLELLELAGVMQDSALICGSVSDPADGRFTYGGCKLNVKRRGIPVLPNGDIQECDLINGNCVLVPKFVVDKIGILDPVFKHAIGDYDYGLRAKRAGIKLFITRCYIGSCSKNISLPLWCRPGEKFGRRLKNLYSPLGNSEPITYSRFVARHFGLMAAVQNFLSIHARLMFPGFWMKS